MPITPAKAPKSLPKAAAKLWADAFNGAFESSCQGSVSEKDKCAARIAWTAVKKQFTKMDDSWVPKSDAYHDICLTITKASLQPDGSMRWQAVTSDTGRDNSGERTSLELFEDWIERAAYEIKTGFLPDPRPPFLGLSHYPSLDGYGEAGVTIRMFIDGDCFKADGVFYQDPDHPVGPKLLEAVKSELAMIKKGDMVEKPIRISAGWWDLLHFHEESGFTFARKSLTDKCPLCEKGQTTDKVYLKGQLDHFAATRVPMNPRTSLDLEEKSMAKTTRKDDAATIVGEELAADLDEKAKLVGKSEAEEEELPEGMVVRASKIGTYLKNLREKAKMSMADVAKKMPITESTIGQIESGDIETPSDDVIIAFAKVYGVEEKAIRDQLPAKTAKAGMKDMDDEDKEKGMMMEGDEDMPKGKRRKKTQKAETNAEKMGNDHVEMERPKPFGGATSMKGAESYMEGQEKMMKLHSHWDIFKMVMHNIMAAPEDMVKDKAGAMATAVKELGDRIDALKAGLADAYLIQMAGVDDEDYQTADEADDEDWVIEDGPENEPSEVNKMSDTPTTLEEQIAEITGRSDLDRAGKEAAIQEALNGFVTTVKGQLDQTNPVPQAQVITDAVKAAIAPLTERMSLIEAKLGQPQAQVNGGVPVPVEVSVTPQQKSFAAGQPAPQANLTQQAQSAQNDKILAMARKSVGLQ